MDVSCKGWVFIQASVTALLPRCQLRWMNQSTGMNEGTNNWKRWSTSLLTVLSEKQEILQNVCGRVQGCLNSVVLTMPLSGNDFGSFDAVHHTIYCPNWNILLYLIMVKIMKNEATDIIDFWKCKFQSYKCLFHPAALKGSGVLSYPKRAGGRQGRQAPLTLSRPYLFTDHFQTLPGHLLP